jgi:antitoxin (DNA-binding transcriptional repressor) of toxin-antitoxin stability system
MKHQIVTVTEFKARCLAMLDDIGQNGGTITITKRGKPLAKVGPTRREKWKSPRGSWAGKLSIPDEVLMADMSELWEVVRQDKGGRI